MTLTGVSLVAKTVKLAVSLVTKMILSFIGYQKAGEIDEGYWSLKKVLKRVFH